VCGKLAEIFRSKYPESVVPRKCESQCGAQSFMLNEAQVYCDKRTRSLSCTSHGVKSVCSLKIPQGKSGRSERAGMPGGRVSARFMDEQRLL
jgi:hypothetical protein